MGLNLDSTRIIDPVISQIASGYANADGVAGFIAPPVYVSNRSGRTLVFGKESFTAMNLFRAPGSQIQRVTSGYTTRSFALRQEAISWEITEEAAQEAKTAGAQIDLRKYAALDAAARLMQSWEIQVADTVTNTASYEASNIFNLSGADRWATATSDIEMQMDAAKEAIRSQIGQYPNKLMLSPEAFNALKTNKRIRQFLQRGMSVTEKVLADLFNLSEVRVARRLKLNPNTGLLENIYSKNALLFYSPGATPDGFSPAVGANFGTPAYSYSYTIGPVVSTPERFDLDHRVFRGDLIIERSIELLAMGNNGLCGGGALFANVVD